MRKLAACKAACENCRGLAGALAGAGEGMTLTPEELAELLDRLEELDAVAGKLEAAQDSLEEIERAIALRATARGGGPATGGRGWLWCRAGAPAGPAEGPVLARRTPAA